jgi:hypothetical protein
MPSLAPSTSSPSSPRFSSFGLHVYVQTYFPCTRNTYTYNTYPRTPPFLAHNFFHLALSTGAFRALCGSKMRNASAIENEKRSTRHDTNFYSPTFTDTHRVLTRNCNRSSVPVSFRLQIHPSEPLPTLALPVLRSTSFSPRRTMIGWLLSVSVSVSVFVSVSAVLHLSTSSDHGHAPASALFRARKR